jgi:hypothetical protein
MDALPGFHESDLSSSKIDSVVNAPEVERVLGQSPRRSTLSRDSAHEVPRRASRATVYLTAQVYVSFTWASVTSFHGNFDIGVHILFFLLFQILFNPIFSSLKLGKHAKRRLQYLYIRRTVTLVTAPLRQGRITLLVPTSMRTHLQDGGLNDYRDLGTDPDVRDLHNLLRAVTRTQVSTVDGVPRFCRQ